MTQTSLVDKMRALAESHPRGAELKEKADKLEAATTGFYSEPQTVDVKRFIGSWARARRLWCDITGEPLI